MVISNSTQCLWFGKHQNVNTEVNADFTLGLIPLCDFETNTSLTIIFSVIIGKTSIETTAVFDPARLIVIKGWNEIMNF